MTRRKRIALLVGQAEEYYQAEFIAGFEKKAFAGDCDVCVFATYQKYQNTAAREIGETSVFDLIPYEDFDGFVLMLDTLQTPGLADRIEEQVRTRAKGAVITVDKASLNFYSVFPCHYEGMRAVVDHMIEEHGYTDITFISGKSWHPYSKERVRAFEDSMAAHGLKVNPDRVVYGDFWYASGERIAEKMLKSPVGLPQAIICANDCMAIGVAKVLTANGIKIPEDVALAGYDSIEEGRLSPVALTSAQVSNTEFGEYTFDALLAIMEGSDPKPFNIPPKLFIGHSCGCTNCTPLPSKGIRTGWDTDISRNSVFSVFNQMDEDLLVQESFYNLVTVLFSYVYQIREFRKFSLCLNENWPLYSKEQMEKTRDAQGGAQILTADAMATGENKFYSNRIMHVIECSGKGGVNKTGIDSYFDRKILYPDLDADRSRPAAYIFTPVYFEDRSYGYAVISYDGPECYDEGYRHWIRSVMRGLEYFRRQEYVKKINHKLEELLIKDPLTGLYNYNGFVKRADKIMFRYRGMGASAMGVLVVDIKDLSKINSTDGRQNGDAAIVAVAKTIKDAFPDGTVFFYGNGEYVVLKALGIDGVKEYDRGLLNLKQSLEKFNESHDWSTGIEIYYGIQTGTPKSTDDLDALISSTIDLKNERKKNLLRDSASESGDDPNIRSQVEKIINTNSFKYEFQPIISVKTGGIYAYEALMRTAEDPALPPLTVIEYAAHIGRLNDIEMMTFTNVMTFVDSHSNYFEGDAKIFLNSIPGNHLSSDDLSKLLPLTSRNPGRFVIELTEQTEITEEQIVTLKKDYDRLGVETAIDDYGAGYSNTGNLLKYMPNYLKIDRSLLSGIDESSQKQNLVADIISFCHNNSITVIAEGVETREELRSVIHLGADLIQGYYVARPSSKISHGINPEIKETILEFERIETADRNAGCYYAGSQQRISLKKLAEKEYKTILISSDRMTFRDLTIVGQPGEEYEIALILDDDYSGQITFENISLSGRKTGSAIELGDNCDVVMTFKGENNLNYGGIKVPESSTVRFEGDGAINITLHGVDVFGIGAGTDESHGKLIFEQDGTMTINAGANNAIGIGSGLGGEIIIRRGRYVINLSGQVGVAIGSLENHTQIRVAFCAIEVESSLLNSCVLGSITGTADIFMEHVAFVAGLRCNSAVGIGTMSGDYAKVGIYSGNVRISAEAETTMAMGSVSSPQTEINTEFISANCQVRGNKAGIIGSFEDGALVSMVNSLLEGELTSVENKDIHAADEDITIVKGRTHITVNDEAIDREPGE